VRALQLALLLALLLVRALQLAPLLALQQPRQRQELAPQLHLNRIQ
jgi:hypothetical protein